ncbi:lens fiber membrane intrinsic protein-like [Hemicordylus capensis]|uniref:lens fiber membrane intrinsic protein-like n=1 Tax=Hemicordylus capensis TaxID=884348 RepID=UPI002304B81E|nr:lens fiber membrane intrinsic protein-like [Hemicordylus capensis]
MWEYHFFKFTSLSFYMLGTGLLITALSTDQWVVNYPTILGPASESLWTYCLPSGCGYLDRGRGFISVVIILGIGAVVGCFAILGIVAFSIWRNTFESCLNKAALMPAICSMIGMSVYTGAYTRHVDAKYYGWSFILGWSSFPLNLVAAILTIFFEVFYDIEEGGSLEGVPGI